MPNSYMRSSLAAGGRTCDVDKEPNPPHYRNRGNLKSSQMFRLRVSRSNVRSRLDSTCPFWHSSRTILGEPEPMDGEEERAARKRSIFDWIVLLGMVINLVIAVFMILYYFDLL